MLIRKPIWKGTSKDEGTNKMSKLKKHGRGYGPKEELSHLYLVLDDWSWGYSIRKIDLSSGDPGHQQPTIVRHALPKLPTASFKFEAQRGYPMHCAAAFGSKILAMQPMNSKFKDNNMDGILIYDVRMRSFIVGPPQSGDPVDDPIYIPVGGRLFALAAGSFQLLYPPPYHESDWQHFEWRWLTLPEPPFEHHLVACYAVHGDQRTIFVSTGGQAPATYSFDTSETLISGDCGWKRHGEWTMPFNGRAYFVPELDVWVGLVGCTRDHTLQIAASDENVDGSQQDLGLKLCKDELNFLYPGEEPVGATLVAMGGRSKFCLMEYVYYDCESGDELTASSTSKENEEQKDRGCLVRLTAFSLKYDKNGDLTTGKRQILQYSVPPEVTSSTLKTPVAFWM